MSAIPTAHIFSTSLGSRSSAAALIGISNVSSILSLLIHTVLTSKRTSFIKRHIEPADFRAPLIFCGVFALAGNILYSCSINNESLGMAMLGRLLIGFGSSEILNLRLLPAILPQESVNTEIAHLAKLAMGTIPVSLAFGSLIDIKVKTHTNMVPQLSEQTLSAMPSQTPVNNMTLVQAPDSQTSFLQPLPSIFGEASILSLESVGYVMAFAWALHLFGLVFFFDIPKSKAGREDAHHEVKLLEEDFDSDTDTYEPVDTNPEEIGQNGTFEKLQTMSRKTVKHHSQHTYRESLTNIRRLMFSNVAFPTTIAILFIAKITSEMLLSSCGTISSKYFNWSGAR